MFKPYFLKARQSVRSVWVRFVTLLTKRPTVSFFALIFLLFCVIALGHSLRTPKNEQAAPQAQNKETAIFVPLSDIPRLKIPAEVKKENVVKIVALSPGIVSRISVSVGSKVWPRQTLLTTTADYNSGKAGLEKAIAANNAALTEDLARIDKRIFKLEEKKIRHDATLTDTAEDVELANLKKERATRKTTLANNPLQLQVANLSDAVFKPKTFVAGIVQSIEVKPGDFVTAGETLVTIRSDKGAATLEALVSPQTAELFDPSQETILRLGKEKISLLPTYFSQQETTNGLFSILFTLSSEVESRIADGEFLSLDLPLRAVTGDALLLPIDAVFQDNNGASVLVEENGKAQSKTITLGNTFGSFVEVTRGLEKDARVILNHSVISGDDISVR